MRIYIVELYEPYEQSVYFYFSTLKKAENQYYSFIGDYLTSDTYQWWSGVRLYRVPLDVNKQMKDKELVNDFKTTDYQEFCSQTHALDEQTRKTRVEKSIFEEE